MSTKDDSNNIYSILSDIQCELKAPKNQKNAYQGWSYRKTEDILEAAKPLLKKHNALIVLTDELVQAADNRFYIKSSASIHTSGREYITASAMAREPLEEKGKQAQQITGASSTYARKIALCGLLAIDGSGPKEQPNYSDSDVEDTRTDEEKSGQLSDAKVKDILDACKPVSFETDRILKKYNIKTLYQLTNAQYEAVIKHVASLAKNGDGK